MDDYPFMIPDDQQYTITDYFDNNEEFSAAAFGVEEQAFFHDSLPYDMIPRNGSTTSLVSASSSFETPHPNALENPSQHHWNNNTSPMILTFGDSYGSYNNLEEASNTMEHAEKKTSTPRRIRPPSQNYDHIIAERKRREQLSQQFVTLSSIVPGLKKMDKTSVLGDTINYLNHLKEREKELEERAMAQNTESMVLVKQSQLFIDDEEYSKHEDRHDQNVASSSTEQPLPEIDAKVYDKQVLLRILCEKHKGTLAKILHELEKLNLAVTSTNVAPFGSLALDVTIVTQMRKDFNMSTKELVQALGSALGRRPFKCNNV